MEPKSVAVANNAIQAIAAGCSPTFANSDTPPKIIPRPPVMVNPKTIVGTVNRSAGAGIMVDTVAAGSDRLAPQRLQYFNSTAISLPQEGQYIANLQI